MLNARSSVGSLLVILAALLGCRPEVPSASRNTTAAIEEHDQAFSLDEVPSNPVPEPFAQRFRLLHSASLHDQHGRTFPRPDFCAVSSDIIYFGQTGLPYILVWDTTNDLAKIINLGEVAPAGLTVQDDHLFVLDGSKHYLGKYTLTGGQVDLQPLNSGQTVFSLLGLGDEGWVFGGVRWETDDRMTLLTKHDADGRHQNAFFPVHEITRENKIRIAPPVHVASHSTRTFWAAETGRPTIYLFDAAGQTLDSLTIEYASYRPQPAMTIEDFGDAEAWIGGWDPLIFLHQSPDLLFVAFETRQNGARQYRLEIRTLSGETESTALLHHAQPLCGENSDLIFVTREGEPAAFRYRHMAPEVNSL